MSPRTTQKISARQLARQRDAALEAEKRDALRRRRNAAVDYATAFEAGRRQRDDGEHAMAAAVVGLLGLEDMSPAEMRRRTGATDSQLRRLVKLGRGQPDSPNG